MDIKIKTKIKKRKQSAQALSRQDSSLSAETPCTTVNEKKKRVRKQSKNRRLK